MIRHLCLLFLMSGTCLLSAQQAEKILPLSHAIHTQLYYQTQVELWKAICEGPDAAPDDWHNYYRAARNYNTLNGQRVYDVTALVQQAAAAFPDSFEAKYLLFADSPFEAKRYDLMLEAYAIDPERVIIFHNLLHYYKVTGDEAGVAEAAQKLHRSNWYVKGIIDWNYNVLQSVAPDAILLTFGDNDTYPAWMLQATKGIRTDVDVFNIHLLLYDADYRKTALASIGLTDLELPADQDFSQQLTTVVQQLATQTGRFVHLGITASRAQEDRLAEQLFLTGLAFVFSEQPLNNLPTLARNVEERFVLDDLRYDLTYDQQEAMVNYLNLNYLPALTMLHDWYLKTGKNAKATEMKELAYTIADRADRNDYVTHLFAQPDLRDNTVAPINFRKLDKELLPVKEGVYAHATEVTRTLFATFLADLYTQGKEELAAGLTPNQVDWRSLLPEAYQDLSLSILQKNCSPEDDQAPVVNISHAAAEAFCEWMTEQYNQSDHRKKQFQQVRFRLPTAEEWVAAARGRSGPYPWGGPYIRNAKGCYLSNFNPHLFHEFYDRTLPMPAAGEESPGEDGGYFPVLVDAYFMNDNGFYNMAGNAAELLAGGQQAKGGSWLDPAHLMQIDTTQDVELPSPAVGFRIFMDVIEE
ncbi:MAG: SUMF1/EgtB/PvdO family nonheme iron enzyme [Bacteroidota bacterium]